jgi:hypothetical protein
VLTRAIGSAAESLFHKGYDVEDWASSMQQAKSWLTDCMNNHSICQGSLSVGESDFVPTRLINVGTAGSQMVYLQCHCDQSTTRLPYATLSHCWGRSKTLQLTAATEQRLLSGIPISELAQTFQEAIFTVQQLGIQFIWMDTLSIFQDSDNDWQREASRMSKVYNYAVVNIAADIAADSDAGCRHKRPKWSIEPCTVTSTWSDTGNGLYQLWDAKLWKQSFQNMPLRQRAWVVQEMLLAPRVLHLCGTQMWWVSGICTAYM